LLETIATQLLETEVIEGEKLHQLLAQVQPAQSENGKVSQPVA
jgi:cell division protease FtsH